MGFRRVCWLPVRTIHLESAVPTVPCPANGRLAATVQRLDGGADCAWLGLRAAAGSPTRRPTHPCVYLARRAKGWMALGQRGSAHAQRLAHLTPQSVGVATHSSRIYGPELTRGGGELRALAARSL